MRNIDKCGLKGTENQNNSRIQQLKKKKSSLTFNVLFSCIFWETKQRSKKTKNGKRKCETCRDHQGVLEVVDRS